MSLQLFVGRPRTTIKLFSKFEGVACLLGVAINQRIEAGSPHMEMSLMFPALARRIKLAGRDRSIHP